MALADEDSPAFVARAMSVFGSMFIDMPKIADAFRGDGALSWGDHHPCLFSGTEWFFRTGYRAELPGVDRALDGVADKLRAGATIADVGCGHGASAVVLAKTFPSGADHRLRLPRARRSRPPASGPRRPACADHTSFEVADAKGYEGTFDLICFFDCLHDMGDPVGIARYALDHSPRTARCCWSSRMHSTGGPTNIAGQPDRGAALHGVVLDLHPELALPGSRPRSRGPGR